MKTNSKWYQVGLVAMLSVMVAACSSDKKKGDDPVGPQSSPKVQALKVTPEGESESLYNELLLSEPPSTVTYFFDFKPTQNMKLEWSHGTRAGIDCDISRAKILTRWMEIRDGNVVSSRPWETHGDVLAVEAGKDYKLSLTLEEIGPCGFLSLNFVIRSRVVRAKRLGEFPLELGKSLSLAPAEKGDDLFYDFHFRSDWDRELAFTSMVEMVDTRCETEFRKELEWLTLDSAGLVVNKQTLTDFSRFIAQENTQHILRVRFKNNQNCAFTSLKFTVND